MYIRPKNHKQLCQNNFITKAKIKHSDKYSYHLVKFETNKTKVSIVCAIHGEFLQRPNDHLSGYGCQKCGQIKSHKITTKTACAFIHQATIKHKSKYTYNNFKYINALQKSHITCKKHGDFEQAPNDHLKGQGCPKCHASTGEIAIESYLQENRIDYLAQYRNPNCKNKKALPFDFAIKKNDNVVGLIEYQGIQHFEEREHFGKENFLMTQYRDQIKIKFCLENNIPLLAIPYTAKKEIPMLLKKFIASI